MTTTAVDTTCKITNDSGKDVVILSAHGTASGGGVSPTTGYEQSLKTLKLASGHATLANEATDSITLDDTRQSHGQTKPDYLYQLLISRPAGLFPVMDVSEALDFTSRGYPAVTVTRTAADNMVKAFAFMQNLMSYPGSKLAVGFATAMKTAAEKESPSEMMQTVIDYFNTTKSYQGLDFPSYLSVSSHMKAFAWTWGLDASGAPGRTYHLYAESDLGKSAPSTQGTVTFAVGGDSASDPASDHDSGYTITLKPTTGAGTRLRYDRAQFVDDTSSDVPRICLQGAYALKSTFTQKPSDNVLWPILLGTVNGTKVIGVSQAPESAFSSWLRNLLPKSFNDLVNTFLKIMGIVMAIDFLKTKLAGKKEALDSDEANDNGGQPPDDGQRRQADADSDAAASDELEAQRGNARRLSPEGSDPIDVPDASRIESSMADSNKSLSGSLDQMQGDQLQGSLNEADGQIKEVAKIGVTDDLQDAMETLVDANEAMPVARQSGDFGRIAEALPEIESSVNAAVQELGDSVSEQVQQTVEQSQAVAEEYREAAESINDQSETVDAGDEDFEPEITEP